MKMFHKESFDVFQIEGLDPRMTAIRSEIQPIFQELDDYFKELLSPVLQEELTVHIAQHRRRSVHPPENTWSAISRQKRGYKMEPHFQLGIFPDYVFMWLAFIDQPKGEKAMAQKMLDTPSLFTNLPAGVVLSLDHTQATLVPCTPDNLETGLRRFRDVKKGEFQIGRIITKDSPLWEDPVAARDYMLATFQALVPIYQATINLGESEENR